MARARKYYESGVAAGNAIIFYLSIPVGVASAPAAVAKFASVCKSARFKIVVLPKNSSVYFGSLAGGIQSFLDRLALRISYATYTVNATTTRVVGPAVAYVNDALIAAKIGTRASAVQFIGVSPARFTSRELERGHLISKQFGGRGIQANLVPMYHRVNQVEMRNVEKQVEAYAKQGKDVQYSVEAIYGTPPGGHPSIPEFIKVDIIVDGVKVYDDLIPNVP